MIKRATSVATLALAAEYGAAFHTGGLQDARNGFFKKDNVFSCMACSGAMDGLDALINSEFVEKVLLTVSEYICIFYGLALTPVKICPQIVP